MSFWYFKHKNKYFLVIVYFVFNKNSNNLNGNEIKTNGNKRKTDITRLNTVTVLRTIFFFFYCNFILEMSNFIPRALFVHFDDHAKMFIACINICIVIWNISTIYFSFWFLFYTHVSAIEFYFIYLFFYVTICNSYAWGWCSFVSLFFFLIGKHLLISRNSQWLNIFFFFFQHDYIIIRFEKLNAYSSTLLFVFFAFFFIIFS